ncbi:MAG: efflux RND transporter periplasmic adaptor subunit, partial [Hyphomicrobiaceae bacterium]
MRTSSLSLFVIVLAAAFAVAGCEKEQPEVVPAARAIKTYTVTEVASGQTRKFSGQVYATDSSTLSFEVGGNVKELRVKQGDKVAKGQVLGVVDKEPYQIDIQSAEAEREKARAKLTRARQEYERQETLHKKGWSSEARLERHLADRNAAKSQLDYANSKLSLAKRNLVLTELKAPYAGRISRKHIEAFVEARKGQPVFDIEASGALEARFDIPETIISRITLGMPVSVKFPTAQGTTLRARITEIGSSAGTANAFPAKAGLDDPPPEVRSGMTVEA